MLYTVNTVVANTNKSKLVNNKAWKYDRKIVHHNYGMIINYFILKYNFGGYF